MENVRIIYLPNGGCENYLSATWIYIRTIYLPYVICQNHLSPHVVSKKHLSAYRVCENYLSDTCGMEESTICHMCCVIINYLPHVVCENHVFAVLCVLYEKFIYFVYLCRSFNPITALQSFL